MSDIITRYNCLSTTITCPECKTARNTSEWNDAKHGRFPKPYTLLNPPFKVPYGKTFICPACRRNVSSQHLIKSWWPCQS